MRAIWRVAAIFAALFLSLAFAAPPQVLPGTEIELPRDFGAHDAFQIEWWYVTGWLTDNQQHRYGFQITFFRSRNESADGNKSQFAPKQILFAHAALSDPQRSHLLHEERMARAGFGLAEASSADMDLKLDNWVMRRDAMGTILLKMAGAEFAFDLALAPTQNIILQGDKGFSKKGQGAGEASYYFSQPHLAVQGTIRSGDRLVPVTGEAWLDREWSSHLLEAQAVGWDWLAANMDDGGALTLFRLRDKDGQTLWAGGSWRDKEGKFTNLAPDQVKFTPGPLWQSPHTGARYPITPLMLVQLPDGEKRVAVEPLFADQELDSRSVAGPVYWEGAVSISLGGTAKGRGYLELTGYVSPLKF